MTSPYSTAELSFYAEERRTARRKERRECVVIALLMLLCLWLAIECGQLSRDYRILQAKYDIQEMSCSAMFQAL